MAQAQLPEWARSVLEVDEGRFRELVRELARSELLGQYYGRRNRLSYTGIVLGRVGPGIRWYKTIVEAPSCRQNYGDDRGVFLAAVNAHLQLEFYCVAGRTGTFMDVAVIWSDGEITTAPWDLYNLYRLLYKDAGTGARPLLELAKQAEAEGDRDVAGVLRKLYAVMEASGDIVREIEQADYSGAETEAEREVERKVKEAAELLKRAKELARRGDAEGLRGLLGRKVIEAQPITLGDIIDHLRTGQEYNIKYLLSAYSPYTSLLVNMLREADIYDVFITVAEHFGLETRRP